MHRPRGRDDRVPVFLERDQFARGDGFDFRHDEMRPLDLDDAPERDRIQHVDDVAAIRDLHGGRIVVAIGDDRFHAEPLQLDDDFLAELAAAEKQDLGRAWGKRAADRHSFLNSSRV